MMTRSACCPVWPVWQARVWQASGARDTLQTLAAPPSLRTFTNRRPNLAAPPHPADVAQRAQRAAVRHHVCRRGQRPGGVLQWRGCRPPHSGRHRALPHADVGGPGVWGCAVGLGAGVEGAPEGCWPWARAHGQGLGRVCSGFTRALLLGPLLNLCLCLTQEPAVRSAELLWNVLQVRAAGRDALLCLPLFVRCWGWPASV
jgi:hypothetical protein